MLTFLLLLALSACGGDGDNPVASEDNPVILDENLVGTWQFDSSDIVDILISNFVNLMRDLGYSQSEIDAAVPEMRAAFSEDSMFARVFTFRLNANGAYVDNSGNIGTWRTEGNVLITTYEDGDEERVKYFVDSDDLTLIYSFKAVFDDLSGSDDPLADEALLGLSLVVDEDDNFRAFFKRT